MNNFPYILKKLHFFCMRLIQNCCICLQFVSKEARNGIFKNSFNSVTKATCPHSNRKKCFASLFKRGYHEEYRWLCVINFDFFTELIQTIFLIYRWWTLVCRMFKIFTKVKLTSEGHYPQHMVQYFKKKVFNKLSFL